MSNNSCNVFKIDFNFIGVVDAIKMNKKEFG